MTTQSENENKITIIEESSSNQAEIKQDEIIATNEQQEEKTNSTSEIEEKNNINDDEPKKTTTTTSEDENRPKKSFHSKMKYSSMAYHRSPYYTNGHSYFPPPYYYYQVAPINEKPTPLMVIPTQPLPSTDNQTNNPTTTASPQNLPPRLRQISTNENDSNSQQPAASSSHNSTTTTATTNHSRRHRSIFSRGSCNYYPAYPPPPPLMATPPGVLFPYPPTLHPPGHIAYNIRTPDELELLAFQQQFMNMQPPTAPPLIWPPSTTYPPYATYPMYGPAPYMYNNSATIPSNNAPLNPDAAEWVPVRSEPDNSSTENKILIDDEINFPPLNTNRTEENNNNNNSEQKSETTVENNSPTVSSSKPEPTNSNPTPISSSSQDDNKHLSSSKLTTITYSTVILQTPDRNKSNKNHNNTTSNNKNINNNNNKQHQNHVHVQLPTKQRTQIRVSKDITNRRHQPPSQKNTHSIEVSKQQQQQSTDDWIEVKSKKTKKFDRSTNDIHYENTPNTSQKIVSDESINNTTTPPSSLSSNGENTTTTTTTNTSEDEDLSDKNKVVMIVENKTITTTTDYNQVIVEDIHRRLDNGERLLIIMRGCPGSGKSTLAKSLNNGYNGQILSTDEYFKDMSLNDYLFEPSKLDKAYIYNRRLASDAFKRNISPIIIDNTNTTAWEMKPYVAMGKEAGYDILLIEPQTPWRYKPRELVKRNLHNLPLRRIKEILNRFEHNVTVQSLIDQIKTNIYLPCQSQAIVEQNQIANETNDPILIAKKSFDMIDDSNILDDVRLCINDMILFLTSNFYQTSLSIPYSDLSLIPSSPSSSTATSTPHSLFHRSLSRFSSTNQDHSLSNEHILRLPTTSFSRCFESLTPPSSTNSSIIGKKRRKNKNKQQEQQSNEILLNTNNNNNNNNNFFNEEDYYLQQATYHVYLPEDSMNFLVIDDSELDNLAQQDNYFGEQSSTVPRHQQKATTNKKADLLNILHDGLTTTSTTNDQRPSLSRKHIAIQCSPNDLKQNLDSSDRILIGRLSPLSLSENSSPVLTSPGYKHCGIQVDLNENNIDSLESLIEFYSNCVSSDIVKQFYELCNSDIQWTKTHIDDYLQNDHVSLTIPTLRQLSLKALNEWDEEIKHSNPSFNTISIEDLLQDINDEDIIQTNPNPNNSIEFNDSNQIIIPYPILNSLQELYGELPLNLTVSNNLSLPLDDELSMNIYQALQRFLGVSNKTPEPVNEKKSTKESKKVNKQQQQRQTSSSSRTQNQSRQKTNVPSFEQIMNEEAYCNNVQKSTEKRSIDYASRHKLKELERQFPDLPPDVIQDIFFEHESDYDFTYACILSMLDENASMTPAPKSQPLSSTSNTRSTPITTKTESVIQSEYESYEAARHDSQNYALKRKEYYNKADQANRHGMTGVASYYINQAHEQTKLMKEANRIACEYISKTRLKQFYQTNRLDLHDLHADEALQLFQQVEQELTEGVKRTTLKSIEVITGYGKSSPYGGGTGKIRSAILNYVQQKKYK